VRLLVDVIIRIVCSVFSLPLVLFISGDSCCQSHCYLNFLSLKSQYIFTSEIITVYCSIHHCHYTNLITIRIRKRNIFSYSDSLAKCTVYCVAFVMFHDVRMPLEGYNNCTSNYVLRSSASRRIFVFAYWITHQLNWYVLHRISPVAY
jgi:hypothetical protein